MLKIKSGPLCSRLLHQRMNLPRMKDCRFRERLEMDEVASWP